MAENIEARVIAIIAEQAGAVAGTVGPETTLEVLGLDSIALVEAIFAIEEEFDISVPFNANAPGESGLDLSSLGAIARAVAGLVAAGGG